jgi:O-antigen ligase
MRLVGPSTAIVPGIAAPTASLELWYYAQIIYAVMGAALGLSTGYIGVAALSVLALLCFVQCSRRPLAVLMPVALVTAFGVSHILVQMVVFREALMGEMLRPMISWMLNLLIIQCLALRRGFLHRSAIATFVIGLCTVPFMVTNFAGSNGRVGLSSGISIGNPNSLAAWFGFCCVYFVVMALESRRMWIRVLSTVAATGSLYVVALTVSRGALFGVALAMLIAFRRVLKRGFVPLLVLVAFAWIAAGLGLFERSASLYLERGLEESGRFAVWPAVLGRILDHPLTGVGGAAILTTVPGIGSTITPHNQFLFVALASGVVPFAFFMAYWIRLGIGIARLNAIAHPDAVFFFPLFVYTLMIGVDLDQPFMVSWVMSTLGSLGAAVFVLDAGRAIESSRTQGTVHPRLVVAPR